MSWNVCAQLEAALLEAHGELARLTFDRSEVFAQAQRRQGSANPSVLEAYREGFSDGTQDSKPPADPPGTAALRARRSASLTLVPLPVQLWIREDLVFGDTALSAAALSPSSRSMPIYIPSARHPLIHAEPFMHLACDSDARMMQCAPNVCPSCRAVGGDGGDPQHRDEGEDDEPTMIEPVAGVPIGVPWHPQGAPRR